MNSYSSSPFFTEIFFNRIKQIFLQKENPHFDLLGLIFDELWKAVQDGNVCLPISFLEKLPSIQEKYSASDLESILSNCGFCGKQTDFFPFILEEGKLYFQKYYDYETFVCDFVIQKIKESPPVNSTNNLEILDSLFPSSEEALQKEAVIQVLNQAFAIITGGPGTGKTSTLAKAIFMVGRQVTSKTILRIVAPTGKAMQRAKESIENGIALIEKTQAEKLNPKVVLHYSTVQALIYAVSHSQNLLDKPTTLPFFHYLVIDESSMLDLEMLAILVQHFHPKSRLILLGDKNQLASIHAGNLFGDMSNALLEKGKSAVELTHSFRFHDSPSLVSLSSFLQEENWDAFLNILQSEEAKEIEWIELGQNSNWNLFLEENERYFRPMLEIKEPQSLFQFLEDKVILTAMRVGKYGCDKINARMEEALLQPGLKRKNWTWFEGKPMMITANQYELNLLNGDVGVILTDSEKQPVFCSLGKQNSLLQVPLHQIHQMESAFAITVHKSQGSEYQQVDLVLGENKNPLLSKELLYTGITRSKKNVRIFASLEALKTAFFSKQFRFTGMESLLKKKL